MGIENIERLILLSQSGDEQATEQIIKQYEALIWKCVRCFYVNGYSNEDLVQVARMALFKAIKKFKAKQGGNFTMYAEIIIRNELRYLLRKKQNTTYDISIEGVNGDGIPYMDLLEDDIHIESDYIKKSQVEKLRQVFNYLQTDEQEFIRIVFSGRGGLKRYVEMKGIDYQKGRRIKAKLLQKLKLSMLES